MTSCRTRALLAAFAFVLAAQADEGMWTFDNPPSKRLADKFGFTPDSAWLDHVRLSALRFPGGSGSFVSADGLVLTNHHVGHGWILAVSGPGRDLVKDGFVAATQADEIKVPGLSLFTLERMVDVSAEVDAAARSAGSEQEAAKAKAKAVAALVSSWSGKTGLEFQTVSLYQGGETWIYGYKKHQDVRLVMAPEYGVAAFGKDWDNFSWTRHDLDFSLFRVYENGKPYRPSHHLAWSKEGLKYGDATFVVGHPGRTSRSETVAQMQVARDLALPFQERSLDRRRKLLHAFAATGGENARQVSSQIMGVENAYKVVSNELVGLKDKLAMAQVEKAEAALRAKVDADPALKTLAGDSWTKVEQAARLLGEMVKEQALVNARGSQLLGYALTLVRLAEEGSAPATPEAGAHGASGNDPRTRLLAPRPLNLEQDQRLFTAALVEASEELGSGHPFVQAMLGGKSPAEAAKAAVQGSALGSVEARRKLLEGGKAAIAGSTDPMIVLARQLDPMERKVRAAAAAAQAVIGEHGARIAKARFKAYGKETYPDATFTLRLSYGAVESYPLAGTLAQPFTTFGGLFDRADAWGPKAEAGSWELPKRWVERRRALDPSTPYDFITSNDIIGGNSGSPVVDRKGELVGLVFDGNIESNAGRFYFDQRLNRSICVDARAIVEALAKVYDAPHLVKELLGR